MRIFMCFLSTPSRKAHVLRQILKSSMKLCVFFCAFWAGLFKKRVFYDKRNPPTPQRHPSGLRAKGPPDKENPRPEPLPGKIRNWLNSEVGPKSI